LWEVLHASAVTGPENSGQLASQEAGTRGIVSSSEHTEDEEDGDLFIALLWIFTSQSRVSFAGITGEHRPVRCEPDDLSGEHLREVMSTVAMANDTTVGDAKRPVQMSFDAAAPRSPRPWRPLLM
jgi:hypothetical protein